MAKNKYYDFFNNYESLTETTKNKKLKKLSNNFDLNILVSLWNDYNKYLESKGNSSINNFNFVQLEEIESTIQVNLISNLKTLYLENDILKWKKYRTGNFTDSEVFANIELKEMINYQISQAYDLLIKSKEPTAPTQQNEIIKSDEVIKELHKDIFKYNAFEVFELYKEKKQVEVNSRTDLRVIFELLKEDYLLLETVELKHYINWINRVYFGGAITELKKQNLNSKPNIIRASDYNEYKKTTLKQP